MTDDNENFRAIVAGSDLLRARWDAVCDKIGAESEERLGVRLDRKAIMMLPSAKLATIGEDPLNPDDWAREAIRLLPAVSAATQKRETAAKLAAGDAETVASFGRMTRAQRLSAAREMGQTTSPPVARPRDANEEARLRRLVNSLSPALRIAKAREYGLIPE